MTDPVTTDRPQPIPLESRALGPDLARGCMLLFIALANSHYFLRGSSVRGGYPQDGTGVDSAVIWLISTFVDGRAYPMFGLLFVGARSARWKDRRLLLIALLFFVLGFVLGALPNDSSSTSDPPDLSMLPPDVRTMVVERAQVFLFVAVLGPFIFMCPFLIGLWAGRRRILEQPERRRTLLLVTASVGIGAAALGAQPISLRLAGVVTPPGGATLDPLGSLHYATGILGGFGYAALLSLISVRLQARPGSVIDAIAAVGQRSMTCYLAQSVVWAIVFTPFLLNLSGTLTVATTALLAATTWLITVALADWMRRTARRGPFEALVRRFTYRQSLR